MKLNFIFASGATCVSWGSGTDGSRDSHQAIANGRRTGEEQTIKLLALGSAARGEPSSAVIEVDEAVLSTPASPQIHLGQQLLDSGQRLGLGQQERVASTLDYGECGLRVCSGHPLS